MAAIGDDVRALFEGPNFIHLACLMKDGSPHSVAIWGGLDGDRIYFFTQVGSFKARQLERDPRVAISVVDHDSPYRTGRVRGRIVETLDDDEALVLIDRLANKYTGADFPMRSGRVYFVEVEHSGFMELPFEHTPG